MNFLLLLSRKYIIPTVLVIAACSVMVRLGFWQLDRLAQRREFNERVLTWVNADPIDLNEVDLSQDFYNMEYLLVDVVGEYDFENQVVLRLKQSGTQAGVTFLTPLKIDGSDFYVLVERGWIPQEEANPENWHVFDELGVVKLTARIRRSEETSNFGNLIDPTLEADETRLDAWFTANVPRIAAQSNIPIIPDIYLQQLPEEGMSGYPIRMKPNIEITEGSHFGYAIQWFTFALILAIGYPVYAYNLESGKISAADD